jgi:predicted  nucleic acid-binding Zn-ribbon protein
VNVAQDDGFELLEEKVKRAAELVKALRQENKELEQQRRQAEARLKEAEKGLGALEKQKGAAAADHQRVEQLDEEVATLRHEREEVRRRIAKLVAVLDEVE